MRSPSLRARLALTCVGVVVVVVAAFAGVVIVSQRQVGLRRLDAEIAAQAARAVKMLGEELEEHDPPSLAARETLGVLASPARPLAIVDAAGSVLATSPGGPTAADVFGGRPPTAATATVASRGRSWRVQVVPATVGALSVVIVAAAPLDDLARDQRDLRDAILVALPIALLLAAAGGGWLATSGLRPVTMMAARAAALVPDGVDDLGPPRRDDEIGRLTLAFNALVARLRRALDTQRQFMADASHELRSPISIVRTAADVALDRPHRDEAEYREALAIASAQARRLGVLVDDMLVLARADGGGYPLRAVDGFLDDVIEDCLQAVGVPAAARRVAVAAGGDTDVAVHADPELLHRLVLNLLQNAVQHTPPGGVVRLEVAREGSQVALRVIDTGPGIPTDQQSRIFDRFVQLDPARRGEGAGLGLTIARWIAEAHAGTLVVESSGPGGTTFRLTLPALAGPAAAGLAAPADGAAVSSARHPV